MFRSEGEDECSHRMQPLSLLNLTHRGEGKRQQRHGDRRMKTRGREMGFQQGREGGREARTGRRDNHRLEKQKVLNTALQAGITNRSF